MSGLCAAINRSASFETKITGLDAEGSFISPTASQGAYAIGSTNAGRCVTAVSGNAQVAEAAGRTAGPVGAHRCCQRLCPPQRGMAGTRKPGVTGRRVADEPIYADDQRATALVPPRISQSPLAFRRRRRSRRARRHRRRLHAAMRSRCRWLDHRGGTAAAAAAA